MNEEEICKEKVCSCLFDVLIGGNESEDCVYPIENEIISIKGSYKDYHRANYENDDSEEDLDYYEEPERLVILSLDEHDTFKIDSKVYTKVLRIMYRNKAVFNANQLDERFDMIIYLVKPYHKNYLTFGHYEFYYKGRFLMLSDCPPDISEIALAYSNISDTHLALVQALTKYTFYCRRAFNTPFKLREITY